MLYQFIDFQTIPEFTFFFFDICVIFRSEYEHNHKQRTWCKGDNLIYTYGYDDLHKGQRLTDKKRKGQRHTKNPENDRKEPKSKSICFVIEGD